MTLPRRLAMLGVPRIRARLGEALVKPRVMVTTARRYSQTSANTGQGAPFSNFTYTNGAPNGQFNGASSADTYRYSATYRVQSFGFTAADVPDEAVIIGVTTFVTRRGSGSTPRKVTERFNSIAISSQIGEDRSTGALISSVQTAAYGGVQDTFGLTLTAADVRNIDFAVLTAANFEFYQGLSDCTLWLDAIGVEITYLL